MRELYEAGKEYHCTVTTRNHYQDYVHGDAMKKRMVDAAIERVRENLKDNPVTVRNVRHIRYLTSVAKIVGDSNNALDKVMADVSWLRRVAGNHPEHLTFSM